MNHHRLLLVISLPILCALLSSCGGSEDTTESTIQSAAPAVVARADSLCREFRGEVVALGKGALANPPESTLALTTERLVRPSIPLLRRMGSRMQALEPAADSTAFDLYANLFDPFLVLTEKRLQAGREEDAVRARGLEEQLTDLSLAQRRAARLAGIHACDLDFPRLLIDSLSG